MKVRELITLLEKMPGYLEVEIEVWDGKTRLFGTPKLVDIEGGMVNIFADHIPE